MVGHDHDDRLMHDVEGKEPGALEAPLSRRYAEALERLRAA